MRPGINAALEPMVQGLGGLGLPIGVPEKGSIFGSMKGLWGLGFP